MTLLDISERIKNLFSQAGQNFNQPIQAISPNFKPLFQTPLANTQPINWGQVGQNVQQFIQPRIQQFQQQTPQFISNAGKFIGQQPIINNPVPFLRIKSPTYNQIAKIVAPNSAISAFTSGQPEQILPNLAKVGSLTRKFATGDLTPEEQNTFAAFMLPGGMEFKAGGEGVIALAKKAGTTEKFTNLLKTAKPEIKTYVNNLLKSTKNPINTVEDLFNHIKSKSVAQQPLGDVIPQKLQPLAQETRKELVDYGVQIDTNGIATVYRGGNVSETKLKDLRYNDFLSSVKTGKDITGNEGASAYGKNVVELKIPVKDLKITNGELQYIGKSTSLIGGVKYPSNFYKEYNDYFGSNLTAKEIEAQTDVWDVAKALSGYDVPKTQKLLGVPENITTKSQLTDFYTQATGGVKPTLFAKEIPKVIEPKPILFKGVKPTVGGGGVVNKFQPTIGVSKTELNQLTKEPVVQAGKAKALIEGLPKSGTSQQDLGKLHPLANNIPPTPPNDKDLITQLTQALKEAKPLRGQQEVLYTKARGQKFAKVMSARSRVAGEKGFFAELGALKGQLPKVEYETIRQNFNQASVDRLFDIVRQHKLLPEWDKITAQEGLAKILGKEGGTVPTKGEIERLYTVFGKDFTEALLSKRSILQKLGDLGLQLYNVPRSLMAGVGDLSGTLMQNLLFAYRHPIMTTKNFGRQLKMFASEDAFRASQEEIMARPTFDLMRKARVQITEMGPMLGSREEQFMSPILEKVPILGTHVIRPTSRAYTGFLNRMRADVFDQLVSTQKSLGQDINDPNFLKWAGTFVNAGTGRGMLGPLERSAGFLSQAFFSARKLAATFQMFDPRMYTVAPKAVRQEALKTVLSFVGGGLLITQLAKMGGATVSDDPTNADFGKIKFGNTRLNVFGSYQQLAVLLARMIKGYGTSSTTGRKFTLDEGFKPVSRLDLASRFFESKQHPTLSLIFGIMRGQNTVGQSFNFSTELLNRFVPMVFADGYDLYKEHGPQGLLGLFPAILGIPVQTYGKQVPILETTPTGKPTIKLKPTGGIVEDLLGKVTNTPSSNIPKSQHLGLIEAKNQDIQVQIAKDEVRQSGQTKVVGGKYIYFENGEVKSIQLDRPIYQPKLTGNTELDKKVLSKFNTSITAKANDIVKLYELGKLSADETEKQLEELKITKAKYATPKKGKKPARITISKVKPVKIRIAKRTKRKLPAIKISKPPTKTISIKRIRKLALPKAGISYKIRQPVKIRGLTNAVQLM